MADINEIIKTIKQIGKGIDREFKAAKDAKDEKNERPRLTPEQCREVKLRRQLCRWNREGF